MSSTVSPPSAAQADVRLRLKTILALSIVVVVMVIALLVAIDHGGKGSQGWLLGLSWLLLVGLVFFVPTPNLRPTLATHTPVRAGLLACVGLIATLTAVSASDSQLTTLAVVLGAATMVGEQVLRRLGLGRGYAVLQLPGCRPAPRVLPLTQLIVYLQLVFLGYGVLVVALDLPALGWLAIGAATAVVMLVRAASVFLRRRFNVNSERNLASLIEDYAPEFAIYTARPDDASYQISMWLPYLERTGKKFIIVTRAEAPVQAIAQITDAPIVLRKRISDLDDLVVPSLNTIFYVNASSGNGAMVRYSQFTHVYLGHGDSDKAPSYNPTHAMYDQIYAAGPAATRRYAAHGVIIDPKKFIIVGRPQLEVLEPATTTVPQVPTILYAPTWRGHVEETFLHSIPSAVDIVTALVQRGTRVIFRPHPFSYHFAEDAAIITRVQALLEAEVDRTGIQHLYGSAAEKDLDIIGCMNASDAMFSDVSSVVSDYLYSCKPLAMVVVNTSMDSFCSEYPVARAAYLIRSDVSNIEEILDQMLGQDPMRERRAELRDDYLGNFPADSYASAFIHAARLTIEGRDVSPPESVEARLRLTTRTDEVQVQGKESDARDENEADSDAQDRVDDAQTDSATKRPSRTRIRQLRTVGLRLTRYFLPGILAALALGATPAFGIDSVEFLVPALLALAIYVYQFRRGFRSQNEMNKALGAMSITRSVVAVSLIVGFAVAGQDWMSVAGPVLVFASICLEGQSIDTWKAAGLQSRNLPGTENARPLAFARGWAGMVSAFSLICMTVSAVVLTELGILQLLFGALTMVLTCFVLVRGIHRRYVNLELDSRVTEIVEGYGPKFCVYFSSSVGISYQLGMWIPYLDRIGEPYIVVTRDLKMMRAAAKITSAPIIYRKTLASLEEILVVGMTTAFYVNNAVKNTHLVERRELTHIWLNHGDSEKAACYNPVHGIYDKIFAAGQAGIDRYERHNVHIPREKFEIVGRPQVEKISRRKEVSEPQTVLYAPTWRGPYADTAVYSLPVGEDIVRALIKRQCTVIFRAHPFNYRYPEAEAMVARIGAILAKDAKDTGRSHVFGPAAEQEMGFVDCFNAVDAMISDVSAMISDFLQSEKPFAVVAASTTEARIYRDVPAAQSGYVMHGNLDNLEVVLDNLLYLDPISAERSRVREYYLGNFPADSYADGFISAAKAHIESDLVEDMP